MDFQVLPMGRASGFKILTASQMRAADRAAIEDLGVPGIALMENAGRHLAASVHSMVPNRASVLVFCGSGNNGGDGFVAARHLRSWGHTVNVLMSGAVDSLNGDSAVNARAAMNSGVPVSSASEWSREQATDFQPDVVIDALLGTGTRGTIRPNIGAVIELINELDCPVVAADVPSGLCADTGRVLGPVVHADRTVTFQTSKPGHWAFPGAEHCGLLCIVDIGMPDEAMVTGAPGVSILAEDVLEWVFEPRSADSHKGTYGHVGVIGGELGRTGAVHMAADAALAAGAGLVTIGTEKASLAALAEDTYEVMVTCLLEGNRSVDAAVAELQAFSSLVVGPGYPTSSDWGRRLIEVLVHIACPMVIDADALNHAAGRPELLSGPGERVLTPHPGEAARLLGVTSAEVQSDRFGAVSRLVERSKSVVILKGAHTVIGAPSGEMWVCPYGNAGMATAGMGDVLAGIVGALLARGASSVDAACAAVAWHALAGDHACDERGPNGLRARDVISALGEVERCYPD